MRRHVWIATAAALTLALAGCERPAEPGAGTGAGAGAPKAAAAGGAFRHQISQDLSGFYLPASPAVTGRYQLDHVFIGQAAELAKWEAGERSATFAPVMLEFAPVDGGDGESPVDTIRVLPDRYEVTDVRVVFVGRHAALGEVRFSATLDAARLATARRNLGDEEPAMSASLTAEGRTASGVKLAWYGGD